MAVKLLRGNSTTRASSQRVLEDGQPLYEKDTHKLYVGDGTTQAKNLRCITTDLAEKATNATNAVNAEKATNATNAVNAEKATNATNAENTDFTNATADYFTPSYKLELEANAFYLITVYQTVVFVRAQADYKSSLFTDPLYSNNKNGEYVFVQVIANTDGTYSFKLKNSVTLADMDGGGYYRKIR